MDFLHSTFLPAHIPNHPHLVPDQDPAPITLPVSAHVGWCGRIVKRGVQTNPYANRRVACLDPVALSC
jgi:hypothetical protein